jgi:branched-chain amino acid transport system permease protein
MIDRFLPGSPRLRAAILGAAWLFALLLLTQVVLPGAENSAGRGTPGAILFQGFVLGCLSALTATGIVLIYRTLRIINFAATAIGAAGGSFVFQMVRYVPQVPFFVTLMLGLLLSAFIGALFDVGFGRRFFNSPRIVLTVVTVVGASFLGGFSAGLVGKLPFFPPENERSFRDLSGPEGLRPYLPLRGFRFTVGSLPQKFGFPEVLAIELTVVALILVFLFFRFTRTGVAVRALAENGERAKLLGISVGTMTTIVWIIASILAGLSVTMSGLVSNPTAAFGFAPGLLLGPLAAAVIAKMENLPVAAVTAIALQMVSGALQWSFPETFSTFYTGGLFLVVTLGMLNLQRKRDRGRSEQAATTWQASDEPRAIPAELLAVPSVRIGKVVVYLLVGILVGVLPFVASITQMNFVGLMAINGIVALSIVVLSGWAGQVSLGQYGFVAFGALVAGRLTANVGLPFWVAAPLTMALTGAFALVIGIPALRVRGLFLAVSTFAFALAVRVVLFNKDYFSWLQPTDIERPSLFLLDFEDEKSMYFLCVGALVLSIVAVTNLRRSRVGRLLIALKENEPNVQAFGVSVLRLKLLAFVIAGVLCGLAGSLHAHQQRGVNGTSFGPEVSFQIFVLTVIGGLGSPAGAVLGAMYGGAVAYFLSGNLIFGVIAGFAPLLLIYIAPGGFISVINSVRDSMLRIVAQRRQLIVPSLFADYDPEAIERRLVPLADPLPNSGVNALAADQRFTQQSELYRGHGERVLEKLASPKTTKEAAAIGAAAEAADAAIDERLAIAARSAE